METTSQSILFFIIVWLIHFLLILEFFVDTERLDNSKSYSSNFS
jgi:hypothetical protein